MNAMDRKSFQDRETQRQKSFKVIYDYTMGLIWFGAGLFFLLNKYAGDGFGFDPLTASIFGIACLSYGVFRFYRGYSAKKRS